jgi:hypothetical protein
MNLIDFSQTFKQRFKLEFCREIETFQSVNSLRLFLEANYEQAVGYVTSESKPADAEFLKFNRIKKIYSNFMSEYNAMFDFETAIR